MQAPSFKGFKLVSSRKVRSLFVLAKLVLEKRAQGIAQENRKIERTRLPCRMQ